MRTRRRRVGLGILGLLLLAVGGGAGWLWLTVLRPAARGTTHTTLRECRDYHRALERRQEVRDLLYGDCRKTLGPRYYAVSLLRVIVTGQAMHRDARGRYALTLQELFAARVLFPGIHISGAGTRGGYTFSFRGNGWTWSVLATPTCRVCCVGTAASSFFVDQRGVIREELVGAGEASASSPPLGR